MVRLAAMMADLSENTFCSMKFKSEIAGSENMIIGLAGWVNGFPARRISAHFSLVAGSLGQCVQLLAELCGPLGIERPVAALLIEDALAVELDDQVASDSRTVLPDFGVGERRGNYLGGVVSLGQTASCSAVLDVEVKRFGILSHRLHLLRHTALPTHSNKILGT
jgi:hypothetical protein